MSLIDATQRVLLFSLAIGLSACGAHKEEPRDVPATPKPEVRIENAAVPTQFSAALPTTATELRGWIDSEVSIPPRSHVIEGLASGLPEMLARFETASKAVSPSEQREWALLWHSKLRAEDPSDRFCKTARPIIQGPPGTARMALAEMFAECVEDSDREAFLRADTPHWAVLEYFDPLGGDKHKPPFHPRLAEAAREVILSESRVTPGDLSNPDFHEFFGNYPRRAASALAQLRDPRADEALQKILADVRDPEVASEVAREIAWYREHPAEPSEAETRDKGASPDAVRARIAALQTMGFSRVGGLDPSAIAKDEPLQLLLQSGQGVEFPADMGHSSDEYEALLRKLATSVSPQLDETMFAESGPENGKPWEPSELSAWSHGKRFRRVARNDSWYDLAAVIELMNAVMAENKLAERFVLVGGSQQIAYLIAASPDAMAKATKAGYLQPIDPETVEYMGEIYVRE